MAALIPSGASAPDFSLPDLQGREQRLSALRGRVVLLNFWSAECTWSARGDQELLEGLASWGAEVVLWTLAANANEPLDLITRVAEERGLPCVLYDAHQQVADLYGAETTPHVFVIDAAGLLRYQGAVDDITFRQRTATRHYLQEAVRTILAGVEPDPAETQPYGCSIVRVT